MFCSKCNQLLPDDSEFCQYCGTKIASSSEKGQNADSKLVETIDVESNEEKLETHTQKKISYVLQEIFAEDNATTSISDETDDKKRYCKMCGGLIDAETKVCTSCGKQYFKFPKIAPSTIALAIICIIFVIVNILLGASIIVKNEEIISLQDDLATYQIGGTKIAKKAEFMDDHIVIIGKGNNKYHKYGCKDLDISSFRAYNTENAKAQGYKACSKCN